MTDRVQTAESQHSDIERRFEELAAAWKSETQYTSSLTEIVTHPAYQQIIGLGRAALPLILKDLKHEVNHWFWALRALTGENPVQEEDAGKLPRMVAAWVNWGLDHGHLQ